VSRRFIKEHLFYFEKQVTESARHFLYRKIQKGLYRKPGSPEARSRPGGLGIGDP